MALREEGEPMNGDANAELSPSFGGLETSDRVAATEPTFSEMMATVEAGLKGHVMGAPRPALNGGGVYSSCVIPECTALLRWDEWGIFMDAQSNAHIWSCPKRVMGGKAYRRG